MAREAGSFELDNSRASLTAERISSRRSLRVTNTFSKSVPLTSVEGQEGGGKIKQAEAVANFVICCVGAGCVVFPNVLACAGFVQAAVLLALAAGIALESSLTIISASVLSEKVNGLPAGSLESYESIAEAAYGTPAKLVLGVSKNLYMLGCIVAYIVLTVDGVYDWCRGFVWDGKTEGSGKAIVHWFLVGPLFIVLAMIKDLQQLAKAAPIGALAVFVQCGSIIVTGTWVATQEVHGRTYTPWKGELGVVGSSISIFIFGFDAISTLPSMRAQIDPIQDINGALIKGFIIVPAISALVMFCGYAGYGEQVDENVINSMLLPIQRNISGTVVLEEPTVFAFAAGSAAGIAILFNLLISSPLLFFCVISFFEETGTDALRTPMTIPNISFRACLMMGMLLLASVLPHPKEVIGLISAVFGILNGVFFPLLYYYRLRSKLAERGGDDEASLPPLPLWRRCYHVAMVMVSSFTMVYGVTGALESLKEAGLETA